MRWLQPKGKRMRHYELVLLVHPDQSEQVPEMLARYQETVQKSNGNIHRVENIGRLQLAYTIQNMHKAHYVIMNIECDDQVIKELEGSFKFNDSILRHLLVKTTKAETEPSKLFIANNKESEVKKRDTVKANKEKREKSEKQVTADQTEAVSEEEKPESDTEENSEQPSEITEKEDEKSKE